MSEGTIHLVAEIKQRLRALARKVTLARLAYGVVVFSGIAAATLVLLVGLEAMLWMPVGFRTLAFWMLVAASAVGLVVLLGPPIASLLGIVSGPTDSVVANLVGQRFPEVADRLWDLLQLADGQRSASPEPLVDGAIAQLGAKVSTVDYTEAERFDAARSAGQLAKWPLMGLLAFALIMPGTFGSAAKRLMSPGTLFTRPAPFAISVHPGDVALIKGDTLQVSAIVEGTGELPDELHIGIQRPGEADAEYMLMKSDETGSFSYVIPAIREGFQYFARAGDVSSSRYRVSVGGRPYIRTMRVVVTPPSYTGMSPVTLAPDVGDIVALNGSGVDLSFDFGGEAVADGFVDFDSGARVPLSIQEGRASGSFAVSRNDRYRTNLASSDGIRNVDPIDYRVRMVLDQRPAIYMLSPERNSEFADDLAVRVSARITDDFGFSSLALYYRLAESRFGEPQEVFSKVTLPAPARRVLDQQIDYDWLVSEMGLDPVPGDEITFYLEVKDNDSVSGRKAAVTEIHTIRFPSLTDRFESVDEQQDELEQSLENLLNESKDVKDAFEELRDDLRKEQGGDWDSERQIDRLQESQKRLEERISDLAENMESLVDEMTENSLLSEETLERFEELNRVMEEINSPELQEALERLREAMKDMDLTEMQKSLGDFEFNEEQFKERLERALELFKRLRTEQQLEEASQRAEDLSKREEKLSEQTERLENADENAEASEEQKDLDSDQTPNESEDLAAESENSEEQAPDSERLAEEQERAAEDMEKLEQLMQEISEQMDEMSPAPSEEMQEALEQVQEEGLQEQMRQNAGDLRQGELSKAKQSQQQMQQSLQQLSEQLGEMKKEMSGEQLAADLAALRRALDDVLTLSLAEETLREDVRGLASRDGALSVYNQEQSELLGGLKVVGDTLSKLSRTIPQMSRQIQAHAGAASMDMQRAVEEMAERRSQQAIAYQKGAMTNLNELALLLSDLMENMQNQQSGMSGMSMQQMMQQLQQMAGQQGKLNDQIQQFLNDAQGTRLSQDMSQRMQQMAAQQEAIKKQLDEMGQKGGGAADKLLGDLQQIARQMEETISELQGRKIDRRTQQRQQEILSRLLDAQRSMRERGKEDRRQGKSADELRRESPPELTRDEKAERLRRDLLRALESGYAPDYEELIRRYFESLQRKQEVP